MAEFKISTYRMPGMTIYNTFTHFSARPRTHLSNAAKKCSLWNSLFIMSPSACGCAGVGRVATQLVVDVLPQPLLRNHLVTTQFLSIVEEEEEVHYKREIYPC